MAKKNTATANVLENLSQADIDANNAKFAALKMIPDPVWESAIPFETIVSKRDFNVRDISSYGAEHNRELYASLLNGGLEKRGDPMAFNREADRTLTVLVGHLRHAMMQEIREAEAKRRVAAGVDPDPSTLPFATVFGLVYESLTKGQKTAIMADHIGRKDLNEAELCKEIAVFIHENGLTVEQARVRFGIDKNKISRYCWRYAMPTVYDEFVKEKSKTGSFIPVGQVACQQLYSAYLVDQSAGYGYRHEGPNFRKAWEDFLRNPSTTPAKEIKKAKETADVMLQAKSAIATFGDFPEVNAIRLTLLWSEGEPDENGSPIILTDVEANVKKYCDELRGHVTEIESLRNDLQVKSEMLDELRTDYDAIATECNELRETADRLRADYAEIVAERDQLREAKAGESANRRKK